MHVLFVSGQRPGMAEWVRYLSISVSPKHVAQRHDDPGTRGNGPVKSLVDILDIEENIDG